jgi:hypothetical protein
MMPFVTQNFSMNVDLKLGWKPGQDAEQQGAPIPLFYNFAPTNFKEYDAETGQQIEPLYLGPRYPTSI